VTIRDLQRAIEEHEIPSDSVGKMQGHLAKLRDRPSYICSFCNQILIRLTDSSQQNSAFWCRYCSVEFDPESENLRKESKITVPDRNIEAAVASTPGIPDISIRHEPELKDGALALSKKGTIRFTSYHDSSQK
jgi:DNA-directed RNA polymerase subunit RPC12/RpoP